MSAWTEVSDRVYQCRYQPLEVTVAVVRGATGLLLVDTRSSHREADEIRSDLRAFGRAPIRWVVNTHAHYDRCFGHFRFGGRAVLVAEALGVGGELWPFPPNVLPAAVEAGYADLNRRRREQRE